MPQHDRQLFLDVKHRQFAPRSCANGSFVLYNAGWSLQLMPKNTRAFTSTWSLATGFVAFSLAAWWAAAPNQTVAQQTVLPEQALGTPEKLHPRHFKADYRRDRVLVAFHSAFAAASFQPDRFGLAIDESCESPYFTRLNLTRDALARGMTVERVIQALNSDPAVRVAEPDYIYRTTQSLPNDTRFGDLWGLHNTGQQGGTPDADIDAPEAWVISMGRSNFRVAVIDTGVDHTHKDLKANILRRSNGTVIGMDFYNNDNNPMDDNGHGTHVAGTIAATGNNSLGVIGVAPLTKIMPIKFLSAGGFGSLSDAIRSIDFARVNGARVINNSWGGGGFSYLMLEAIKRCEAAGVFLVCAAGNDGMNVDDTPMFPAGYNRLVTNLISVASTNRQDLRSAFSNYGEFVDVAAPGEDILSTVPGDAYQWLSGTSMASPHAAGVMALINSRFSGLTYDQMKSRMANGSDVIPALYGVTTEGRRINAANALENDTKPPSAPTQLRVTARNSGSLAMELRCSGDDGTKGAAARYEVRYSYNPITEENFLGARRISTPPTPGESNTVAPFVITGLIPNRTVYVAARAFDNVSNPSPIAFAAPAQTLGALWFDDVEASARWTKTGKWGVTTADASFSARSWTDSPKGNYSPGSDTQIAQRNFVLATGPMMFSFDARIELEPGWDFLYLEYSLDNGATWNLAASYTGIKPWQSYAAFIPSEAGQQVRARFRLVTDGFVEMDGVYLDNFRYSPAEIRYFDDMEVKRFNNQSPWNRVTTQHVSPTRSWTDSPSGDYTNNRDASITTSSPLNRDGLAPAVLSWHAMGSIETFYDFCYTQISTDGGTQFRTLDAMTGFFPWTHFVGEVTGSGSIHVRFRFVSDGSVRYDGVYIDDMRLVGEPLSPP